MFVSSLFSHSICPNALDLLKCMTNLIFNSSTWNGIFEYIFLVDSLFVTILFFAQKFISKKPDVISSLPILISICAVVWSLIQLIICCNFYFLCTYVETFIFPISGRNFVNLITTKCTQDCEGFLLSSVLCSRKVDTGFGSRAKLSKRISATSIPLCWNRKTSFWPVSTETCSFIFSFTF